MLSLGVKPGEYIVVGDNIKIYVVKFSGGLRFTIDAPRDVRVLRGDVYERLQADGKLPLDPPKPPVYRHSGREPV